MNYGVIVGNDVDAWLLKSNHPGPPPLVSTP
jgi:hypothetical protein